MDNNHKVSGKSERVTMETFEKLGDLIWNDSIVINEIHQTRSKIDQVQKFRLRQGLKFCKLQDAVWLSVISEIFSYIPTTFRSLLSNKLFV